MINVFKEIINVKNFNYEFRCLVHVKRSSKYYDTMLRKFFS